MKRNIFFTIILTSLFLFLFNCNQINAEETIIYENPIASDITYGDHLYKSELNGGLTNTEGIFLWKNEQEILKFGTHERIAVFIPHNSVYPTKEIPITLNVAKKRVYLEFEKELRKQYDESYNFNLPNYTIKGIIDKDTYVSGNAISTTKSILVGDNIPLTIEGLKIKGNNKDNYYLDLSNINITIYPKQIEKVGVPKNKITFIDDIYIPTNTSLTIENKTPATYKKGYKIITGYDIYLENGNERLKNITGTMNLKIKMDNSINLKKVHLFNFYNNNFEEIKYTINDEGYIIYNITHLGELVVMKKKIDLTGLYISISCLLAFAIILALIKIYQKRPKITKYKSLKRSKDYGNN